MEAMEPQEHRLPRRLEQAVEQAISEVAAEDFTGEAPETAQTEKRGDREAEAVPRTLALLEEMGRRDWWRYDGFNNSYDSGRG